jgi:hypothetical protein
MRAALPRVWKFSLKSGRGGPKPFFALRQLPSFSPMNPHSATLLRALATLRVAEIRFNITRDGDSQHHSIPRARIDGSRGMAQPFSVLSVEDLFEAYALTPRRGTYTLRVADGQLAYEPLEQRKPAKVMPAPTKVVRHRGAFARRHEKLAA